MANKKEGFDGDSKQDTLPYQRLIKQSLCKIKKKLIKKCYMDISSYTPSKCRQPQLTSSYLTSLEGGNTSNDNTIDLASRRSQMAIIYKQESWKGEMVQERNVKKKQGPRKTYKQYLL